MNTEERKQLAYLAGIVLKLARGESLTADEEQSLENIVHELGFEKIPEDEFWR